MYARGSGDTVCSGAGGSSSLPSTALTGRIPQDSSGNALPVGPAFRLRAASATNLGTMGQPGGSIGTNVYIPPTSPPSTTLHPMLCTSSETERHGATDQYLARARTGHNRASVMRHSWDGGALSLPELDVKVAPSEAQGVRTPDTIGGLEAVFSAKVSAEHSSEMVRSASIHSVALSVQL